MPSQGHDSVLRGGLQTDTGFKWICPYCGRSGIGQYAEEGGEERALAALRSHILGSNGDGHGPRNEVPADRERELLEYVCCVVGRR